MTNGADLLLQLAQLLLLLLDLQRIQTLSLSPISDLTIQETTNHRKSVTNVIGLSREGVLSLVQASFERLQLHV